jgi:hypothetical protein
MAPSVVDWANEAEPKTSNATSRTPEIVKALMIERSISFFLMNFLLRELARQVMHARIRTLSRGNRAAFVWVQANDHAHQPSTAKMTL